MTESDGSWSEANDISVSSAASTNSSHHWDVPEMRGLTELELLLSSVLNGTIELSQTDLLDVYTELANLQGRLVEFQAGNGSVAEDVMHGTSGDDIGSEGGGGSNDGGSSNGSSSSASTSSNERREHERLVTEKQELHDERANMVQLSWEIPGVIPMVNDDSDESSNSSSSTNLEQDEDSDDEFAPICRFSDDPPPVNHPCSSSWKERILGNLDIAAVLMGVAAIIIS